MKKLLHFQTKISDYEKFDCISTQLKRKLTILLCIQSLKDAKQNVMLLSVITWAVIFFAICVPDIKEDMSRNLRQFEQLFIKLTEISQ